MVFNVSSSVQDGVTTITLSGELDAKAAPEFRDEIEKSVSPQTQRLVLMMNDLDYIASAGLRVLVFARQKLGQNVEIYVVGAQEQVEDTLEKTGVSKSVFSVDSYDASSPSNS